VRVLVGRVENWMVRAPGTVERIEACFSGTAFTPHRHDTYAIGVTLEGVQSFDYRGVTRHSLPGQFVILHPDELHDGRAGDDRAFRYRTAYVAPAHIQDALGGCPLPFIAGAVSSDRRLKAAIRSLLVDYDRPLSEAEYQDVVHDLAQALQRVTGVARALTSVNRQAAKRAREVIEARDGKDVSLAELEAVTGHDRWQLSRDFRALFGTSPYRYLVARRLDKARSLLLAGHGIAESAIASGFADQSHFGRTFKKTFGVTPNAWLRAALHNRSISATQPLAH
jgi:AraC-like DNA-binding protein